MVNQYVPPGFSVQTYAFTIMLSFCLGWVVFMFVLGLKEISAQYRMRWSGRETSKMLQKMSVAEYKDFLVKAEAYAGIPNPDGKGILLLRPECTNDFIRFMVNEHSFLAMIFADKLHPYSKWERLVTFFLLNSFMLTFQIFVASGHAFKKDNTTTASHNEPTPNQMAIYEYCLLAPVRVVFGYVIYYILCAPFDRHWTERARFMTNMAGHVFMVVGSACGMFALWEASLVIKIATSELRENLPNFMYSVMICGNVCEIFLIYLKFVDLSEDSTVPVWIRSTLIASDLLTGHLLAIGQWHKQNKIQIEWEQDHCESMAHMAHISSGSRGEAGSQMSKSATAVVKAGTCVSDVEMASPAAAVVAATTTTTTNIGYMCESSSMTAV